MNVFFVINMKFKPLGANYGNYPAFFLDFTLEHYHFYAYYTPSTGSYYSLEVFNVETDEGKLL